MLYRHNVANCDTISKTPPLQFLSTIASISIYQLAMAASSSTAAHPYNNQWYHVFLNHRGDDGKTFARSLYLRLRDKGLKAFLDQEELRQGYEISPQLRHAISKSSVHVAILSPLYAESQWCLDELVLMLESKAPIIPVFYRVTPTEVRRTPKDGNYDRALNRLAAKRTHEGKPRCDADEIKKWRDALSKVANNSGFVLETCNGEELELELVDKVVECVLELVKKQDLHVADHPTGLNYKLKDFEDTVLLQQHQSGKPQILGIVGLGGIGKTTLAKHFFNKMKSDYPRSCFLCDVKDNLCDGKDNKSRGSLKLKSLQSKLLKELTLLHEPIDNVDTGMLVKPLKNLNALIVLDDVDDVDQVKALLPVEPHELCSGSLILITSRDRSVLKSSRVEESSIYQLTELNRQHSQELFCTYAFGQAYPLLGSECVVDKFLKSCNGLPLSLKVLGAYLYPRNISQWEDELGSLPTKVKECLRISYNALDTEEQQMFLDIACLFTTLDRDTAISMWNGTGWKGRRGLQNLQDKCLIEVDTWNNIRMHEQLRNLGQDIGEKSSPFRLWRWTRNVINDLSQQSSEIAVRGIVMDLTQYKDPDIVRGMERVLRVIGTRSLQIIHAEGDVMKRILTRAELPDIELPNILWLSWNNCPYSSLPSWIPLKNLRILHVSGSELITLWESESNSEVPALLHGLRIINCVKLKRIQGLVHCTEIRYLSVDGCSELQELPSMESLVSLEDFQASKCVKLKRIQGLAHCTKLRWLHVDGCTELVELPSMESLVSLEHFEASGCVKLNRIQGLAHCTKLQFLNVEGCSELEELPSMESLVSLEYFRASESVKLERIQGLAHCTKLRFLYVDGCTELVELPSMESLVSLEHFQASGCVKLKRIQGLAHCTKLRWLHVDGCSELEELPSMESLVSLEDFRASECVKLERIQGLAHCTKLRLLYVDGCSELVELSSMESLVSLEDFQASECVKLKRIQGLAHCTKLQWLHVDGCSELEELPSMESLVSLVYFSSSGCSELEELPSMESLVSLQTFEAYECVKLKRIQGLAHCTKLRFLDVHGCSELEELPSMESLVSLEYFRASKCVKLKRIQGLAHCTKLRLLYVDGCSELEELPSMETLVSLETFHAKDWWS